MFNTILLILKREFSMKIRNKMFWIMALLGPFVIAGIMIVPMGLNIESKQHKIIEVLDLNKFEKEEVNIRNYFIDNEDVSYIFMRGEAEDIKNIFIKNGTHDGLLIMDKYPSKNKIQFYSKSIIPKPIISEVSQSILNFQKDILLFIKANLSSNEILEFNNRFKINNITIENDAYKSVFNDTASTIGLTAGIMIYFFILLYGIQVMRGVIEEKSNRILEIMVISVKPFELMMGKILGIGLVSILQFTIWLSLTSVISTITKAYFKLEMYSKENIDHTLIFVSDTAKAMDMSILMTTLAQINIPFIVTIFLIYFVFSYLLYSAMFAAIGAAVDAETDTQQFVLPITIPLLFTFVMAQSIINNPESNLAFVLSVFPLTSPIAMMFRLPFGVSSCHLILSISLLIGSFILVTFGSAKIFRTGILMYGKKVTLSELMKWIRYS